MKLFNTQNLKVSGTAQVSPISQISALTVAFGLVSSATGLTAVAAEPLPPYTGSSFNEVREVLLDHAIGQMTGSDQLEAEAEAKVYRTGGLSQYQVSASSFVKNGIDVLVNDAIRTTTRREDYYPRLKKLLHPNGTCLLGKWVMTEPSIYTGYFAPGSEALFVGRASVAMSETEKGHKRGFGFAGKLFPTLDPEAKVETANFFTVDVLLGTRAGHFTDVALTNEPATGFDLSMIGLGIKIASALSKADSSPGFRPLYPVAELGLAPGKVAKTPHWMRLSPAPGTPTIEEVDFRNELDLQRHYPQGLKYLVAVSDTTKNTDKNAEWKTLGYIQLTESVTSYGCDRQLHFAHPKLK